MFVTWKLHFDMLEDYGEGKNDVLLKEKDYVSFDNSSSFDEEI